MCGIAGHLNYFGNNLDCLKAMAKKLQHRGPDFNGIWSDQNIGLGLGHRRLSILDISYAGNQPMLTSDKRFVIIFNGEIYNHLEIRNKVNIKNKNYKWIGHSDTETLLAAISIWGLSDTLQNIRGMFAFALWDTLSKNLFLVRDRMGEKPLYYGKVNDAFFFASELKAIRAVPEFSPEIDQNALSLLLRYGYVPCPYSIYKGIFKLPQGTTLRVKGDGSFGEPEEWWSFRQVIQGAKAKEYDLSEKEAVDHLGKLLDSALGEQMVADVPLGALLSGGIDSSLIVALMQTRGNRPVKTFAIGFEEEAYDEARYAKKVAQHLGTDHAELYVTPKQAMDVITRLPEIYDEPFADASQIPTVLVCEMTRRHVSVALSGDAGDELFGGYNRYFWTPTLWGKLQGIPKFVRAGIASVIQASPASWYNQIESVVGPLLPTSLRVKNPGDKLHKIAEVLSASSRESLYQSLVSQWRGPLPLRRDSEAYSLVSDKNRWPATANFSEQMMAVDTLTYLPDDILVKVDRAAMAVSLETRVPFLDERIIDFAWRLPLKMKVRGKTGKWILQQLLHRYVPSALFERPKQGFGVPIEHWLRGPLREWAEELLCPKELSADGFLDARVIRTMWMNHLSGCNLQYALWPILMYQAWKRE